VVPLVPAMRQQFQSSLTTLSALSTQPAPGAEPRLLLRLRRVDLGAVEATGSLPGSFISAARALH
jgi:hypothetical protein